MTKFAIKLLLSFVVVELAACQTVLQNHTPQSDRSLDTEIVKAHTIPATRKAKMEDGFSTVALHNSMYSALNPREAITVGSSALSSYTATVDTTSTQITPLIGPLSYYGSQIIGPSGINSTSSTHSSSEIGSPSPSGGTGRPPPSGNGGHKSGYDPGKIVNV